MKENLPDSYLERINNPVDLKKFSVDELGQVCKEVRDFIIQNAAENGGHFGASLGVVELTVALHYVFNTPEDKLVWDVGHQAYGHKLLTGRRDQFHTNRKKDGLCGFTKPSESEYDAFVAGHASVSISAALGMAVASKIQNDEAARHIAVIGDGSLTGGVAFEGLNNAGVCDADLLVVLNDNQISIDPNVGALKNYTLQLTNSGKFNGLRRAIKDLLLKHGGGLGRNFEKFAAGIEQKLKNAVFADHNFFESLNFKYFGPYDGHDVENLVKELREIKKITGPKILHVMTKKGKGFAPAESEQTKWHATTGFNRTEEELKHLRKISALPMGAVGVGDGREKSPLVPLCRGEKKDKKLVVKKYQEVFGHTLVELAGMDVRVVGITPAMPSGCSMNLMMDAYPDRAFDVGICEQHAVSFAAGLASKGMIPFCNLYSTFAQRAYDQIIHDVCIEALPVIFCLDRGGLVGADGETHHGVFDLVYLRPVPNLIIAAPMNAWDLRNLMRQGVKSPPSPLCQGGSKSQQGPMAIRYPRGGVGINSDNWQNDFEEIEIGTGRCLQEGDDLAILSLGTIGWEVKRALEKIPQNLAVAHYDMRFLKPLDEDLLHNIFKKFDRVITIEEGVKKGGFGSAVLEFMAEHGYCAKVKIMGIPDTFIPHATVEEQWKMCELDNNSIVREVEKMMER